MSNLPPELPPPQDAPPPALELAYETPQPSGNAPMLIRFATIFLIISGSLDLVAFTWNAFMAIMGFWNLGTRGAAPAGGGMPAFYISMMIASSVLSPLLSLAEASLKSIAAYKFLRHGTHRWGWGLAAGIAACLEIWSCPCCFVSWASGFYTIIILCLPHVRAYLQLPSSQENPRAFPVSMEGP